MDTNQTLLLLVGLIKIRLEITFKMYIKKIYPHVQTSYKALTLLDIVAASSV